MLTVSFCKYFGGDGWIWWMRVSAGAIEGNQMHFCLFAGVGLLIRVDLKLSYLLR